MEVTAAKDAAYLQIVSAAKGMDEGVISCEASNRIDSESTYGIIMIQESNLYTIVLVAMILIAVVVFVVIFVIFVAPCLYSKHMKKSRGELLKFIAINFQYLIMLPYLSILWQIQMGRQPSF